MFVEFEERLAALPDMVSSTVVADLLGVSIVTINKRIYDGSLAAIDISLGRGNRRIFRIPKESVIEYANRARLAVSEGVVKQKEPQVME